MKTTLKLRRTLRALLITGTSIFALAPAIEGDKPKTMLITLLIVVMVFIYNYLDRRQCGFIQIDQGTPGGASALNYDD